MITANTADCPSRTTFRQYSLGLLPEEQALDLAGHLDWCRDCQAVLMTLDDADDTLIGRLRTPLSSEPVLAEPQLQDALAAVVASSMPRQAEEDGSASPGRLASDMPGMLGEYRVLAELGRGGMGRVYKALHTKLDRIVAVKVLHQGRVAEPKAIVRFEREMRAVARLAHPNIVQAYDAREIDGTPALIMEFIDGLDLAEIVRRTGPAAVAEACELIRQAALAMQCGHDHGMVHRDIKPSNLMLARSGEVKLLDLGLVRPFVEDRGDASSAEEMTGTGQTMGTADYMAPEQTSDSRTVDIRADLYSLGCTFYKLLAGRVPFSGPEYRTTLEKMNAHAHQPAPSVRQYAPDVPEEVARVLDRMLAKDPGDRFTTPAEVAEALTPWCAGADLRALLARAEAPIFPPLPLGEGGDEGGEPREDQGEGDAGPARQPEAAPKPPLFLASWGWKWLVGQLILLVMAGGLGFAIGVIITIKKNGHTQHVQVPDDTDAKVDSKGNVTIEIPDKPQGAPAIVANPLVDGRPKSAPPAGIAPPVVPVSHPVAREVSDYLDYTGSTAVAKTAEIRARVSGELVKVHIRPGMSVKQGDLLMEIDPRLYRAELDQASNAVKQAKIRLDARTVEFARLQALLRSNAVGQADFDEAKNQRAEAEAALQAVEAALEVARLRLEYTRIVAPFAGKISGPVLDEGNLATADKTVLATVASTDPLHLDFQIDESSLLAIRRKGGDKSDPALSLTVLCGLATDKGYSRRAKMDFVGSYVDPNTGTVACRALLANKDGALMPGMFVRVRLITNPSHKALLVPESAIGSDQGLKYVLVVNDRNVAKHRAVKIGALEDDEMRVVTEGLKAEDWVITSSVQKVRPGMIVKPEKSAPPHAASAQDAKKVVTDFLEAIRKGDEKKMKSLLTGVARQKAEASNRLVAPPPNDNAKIEVDDAIYPTPGHDIAHVPSTWVDVDERGKLRTDKATWVCRIEPEGWRVAGFAAFVFEGEDPLLFNFEDPDDMAKKEQWLKQELARRLKQQAPPSPGGGRPPSYLQRRPAEDVGPGSDGQPNWPGMTVKPENSAAPASPSVPSTAPPRPVEGRTPVAPATVPPAVPDARATR